MGVREDLELQAALIEQHRTKLQGALNQVSSFFYGDLAYQWRLTNEVMMPPPNHDIVASGPYEVTIPVFSLPKWFRLPTDWKPVIGQPAPSLTADRSAIVRGFVREDYPAAKQARDHYVANLPTLSGVPEGQDRDVKELIEFPKVLGRFYEEWDAVQSAIDPLPVSIEDIAHVDRRVSWSGIGADAYRTVMGRQSKAALATATGIQGLRSNVLVLAQAGVDLCKLLVGICEKNANDLANWATTVLNCYDPSKWMGFVTQGIKQIKDNNTAANQAFTQGLQSIQSNANTHLTLDNIFHGMATSLGTTKETITWPALDPDISSPWEGANR